MPLLLSQPVRISTEGNSLISGGFKDAQFTQLPSISQERVLDIVFLEHNKGFTQIQKRRMEPKKGDVGALSFYIVIVIHYSVLTHCLLHFLPFDFWWFVACLWPPGCLVCCYGSSCDSAGQSVHGSWTGFMGLPGLPSILMPICSCSVHLW